MLITRGTFTQVNNIEHFHINNEILDRLMVSVFSAAFHSSGERHDPPTCHPNIRVAALEKIRDWVLSRDSGTQNALIIWLHGPAVSGKSAIARTTAEWAFDELERLLARYSLSRFHSTRNYPGSLVTATTTHRTPKHILIPTQSLIPQIRMLIFELLQHLISFGYFHELKFGRRPIIDELHGCESRNGKVKVLHTISKALKEYYLQSVFLFASLPELDATYTSNSGYIRERTYRLLLDGKYQPFSDIGYLLRHSERKALHYHIFSFVDDMEPVLPVLAFPMLLNSSRFRYSANGIEQVLSPNPGKVLLGTSRKYIPPSVEPTSTSKVIFPYFYNMSSKTGQKMGLRNLWFMEDELAPFTKQPGGYTYNAVMHKQWGGTITQLSDSKPIHRLLFELRANSFKEGKTAQRSEAGERPRHAERLCGAIRKWEYQYGLHHFHPEFYATWGATPPIPSSDQFWIWEEQILHALEGMGDRVIVTANESYPRPVLGFEHLNITNDPEMPGVYVDAPGCWMASLRLIPLWANRPRKYLIFNSLSLTNADSFESMFEGRVINSITTPGLPYTYLGDMYLDSKNVTTTPLRDFIAYNGWAYGADEIGMYYAMDNITVYSARNWWSMVFADPSKRPMPSRNFHWYLLKSPPIYLTSGPPVPQVKAILEHAHKYNTHAGPSTQSVPS